MHALMYLEWINSKSHIIVEVYVGKSREVLTANRDGMQSRYMGVLNRFTQELAVETVSALKPKFTRKNMTVRGRGLFFTGPKSSKATRQAEEVVEKAAGTTAQEAERVTALVSVNGGGVGIATKISDKQMKQLEEVREEIANKRYPDVVIVDDTNNEKVRRVIENYNPANWVTLHRNGRSINKGSVMYKLLMFWKIACEHAFEALFQARPSMNGVVWGIGWIFSDHARAMMMKMQKDNAVALLLNPVDEDGNLQHFLSSMASQKRLMAYAKHEVAHVVETMHNETFAMTLTEIDTHFDERQVYRKMRELEV
jgi:hypothetical protein